MKIKNPYPLVFFVLLLIVLSYIVFFVFGGTGQIPQTPTQEEPLCEEGDRHSCSVGDCNGTSSCEDGQWSSCKWKIICTPGSTEPCTKSGCAYAYRTCNKCGSGYGPCIVPE